MDLICEVNQRQMIIKNLDLIDALFKAVLRRFLFLFVTLNLFQGLFATKITFTIT